MKTMAILQGGNLRKMRRPRHCLLCPRVPPCPSCVRSSLSTRRIQGTPRSGQLCFVFGIHFRFATARMASWSITFCLQAYGQNPDQARAFSQKGGIQALLDIALQCGLDQSFPTSVSTAVNSRGDPPTVASGSVDRPPLATTCPPVCACFSSYGFATPMVPPEDSSDRLVLPRLRLSRSGHLVPCHPPAAHGPFCVLFGASSMGCMPYPWASARTPTSVLHSYYVLVSPIIVKRE